MLDKEDLRNQWLKHLGPEEHRKFPREVAFSGRNDNRFTRLTLKDAEHYLDALQSKVSTYNLYAALYSQSQREERVFDKVVFDLDSTDGSLEGSLRLMKLITGHIEDVYGIEPTVYCTGGKGYHIILHFPEIDVSKPAIRKWATGIASEAVYNSDFIKSQGEEGAQIGKWMLEQVDTSVLGDVMQVTRLPYSYNHLEGKQFRYCVPINPSWDFDRIEQELYDPIKPVEFELSDSIARDIVKVDLNVDESDKQLSFDSKGDEEYEKELLQLFRHADDIRDGRRRILSFLIIPRLVAIGEEKYQAKQYCYDWLKKTGKPPHDYDRLIETQYVRTVKGPSGDLEEGDHWQPWTFYNFFKEYPAIKRSLDCAEDLLNSKD